MSIYKDELTIECVAEQADRVKNAFPSLPDEFFEIFANRIKENNFTNKRLVDSINNVIDNCPYPAPTIASFIKYNKSVKLYTHAQVVKMNDETRTAFSTYRPVKIEGLTRPMYADKTLIERFNLTPFDNNTK